MTRVNSAEVGANVLTISFIVPSYNSYKTLGRTVDSILAQTKADWIKEIIIVDSSDDSKTRDVLASFGNVSSVKLVLEEERFYPAHARNKGAQLASGDILCFIDSDVILLQDWVEHVVTAHKEGCCVGSGSVGLTDSQKCSMIAWAQLYLQFNESLYAGPRKVIKRVIPACNMFCLRTLFLGSGGFPDLRTAEDSLWSLQISDTRPVWFVPEAKCQHFFRLDVRDYLRNQLYLGRYIPVCRMRYYAKWYYSMPWIICAVPAVLISKVFMIIYRVSRTGLKNAGLLFLSSPFFVLGLISWSLGFCVGCFDVKKISVKTC